MLDHDTAKRTARLILDQKHNAVARAGGVNMAGCYLEARTRADRWEACAKQLAEAIRDHGHAGGYTHMQCAMCPALKAYDTLRIAADEERS